MDGGELPKLVLDVLLLVSKKHARNKFNEMHILADINKSVGELRENNRSLRSFVKLRRPQNGLQKSNSCLSREKFKQNYSKGPISWFTTSEALCPIKD